MRKQFLHRKKRSDREGTIQSQAEENLFSHKPFGREQTTKKSPSVNQEVQLESARNGWNFGKIAITPAKNAFPAIQRKQEESERRTGVGRT